MSECANILSFSEMHAVLVLGAPEQGCNGRG